MLDQQTEQAALFGNIESEFTDTLRAAVAYRYLSIEKDVRQALSTASIAHADSLGRLMTCAG